MADALLDEFCRAGSLQSHFFRRCQREFRERIQPQLEERDTLLVENAALKAENAALKVAASSKATKRSVEMEGAAR